MTPWVALFLVKQQNTIFAIKNASRYAIDGNLSEEMQTIFGIIVMPGMVMSLLSQFIIQPFLVKITDYLRKKEIKKLSNYFWSCKKIHIFATC